MTRPRFTTRHRAAHVAQVLMVVLIPGLVLVVMFLTHRADQPDMVTSEPRVAAAGIGSPTPTPQVEAKIGSPTLTPPDDVRHPDGSVAPTRNRSSIATPSVSTPTAASTMWSSPTAGPLNDGTATLVPATIGEQPTATPTVLPPTSVPMVPTDVPETYPAITRLVIPSIGVDAEIEVKSVGSDGAMQAPSAPDVAAWYDFSSTPAGAGNAVFAGHLDYAGYGPAVFWRLGELQAGDAIEVYQQDGTIVRYHVTSIQPFAATDDAREVIGSTGRPTITLITCEGAFDGQARAYDQRLVVIGDRID